ncbi:hypothetical protein [Actinosynnema sp. NPDC023587]
MGKRKNDNNGSAENLTHCLAKAHEYSANGWCVHCGMPDTVDPPTSTD